MTKTMRPLQYLVTDKFSQATVQLENIPPADWHCLVRAYRRTTKYPTILGLQEFVTPKLETSNQRRVTFTFSAIHPAPKPN